MTMLEERLRDGLAAEAQAWTDPPVPGVTRRRASVNGWGVALIAAAAVFVVIGGVAAANRILYSEPAQSAAANLSSSTTLTGEDTAAVAPAADLAESIVEHRVTLSDGTQVMVNLPVVEGSDLPVLWGAGLSRGAYGESHEAAPFSALVHVWFYRSADDVRRELEETEEASGSILLTDNRYIVDHDGHAYDFQFDDSSGTDLPQEILGEWVSAIIVSESPDSILPMVTVSGEYDVDYGPTYSFEGTYVDGEPIVVGITEGCEVEPGAPVEYDSGTRASISSCELDGRVELLISGSVDYIERTRSHEFVRITTNP
ncbi:MAG: hypothetical protein U9N79_06440 [Actinomycetota bacterium]|nr:hypothetical protein [Actinomycetota bacterium]